GGREDLAEIAARVAAEEIVIAIPSASGKTIAELAERCATTGLPFRTTRRVSELVEGRVTASGVRDLDVLDLLPRARLRFEDATLHAAATGKSIAIVGAGGTVGAALAMRALDFGAKRLLLVDRDDNAL